MTVKISNAGQILRAEIIRSSLATDAQLDGEITQDLINKAHSKVIEYLDMARHEDLEMAINRPSQIAASKELASKIRAKKIWRNGGSPYEEETSIQEIQKFVRLYPQFDARNLDNRESMLNFLKDNLLEVTLKNLILAYEQLTIQGVLTILPEAIGLPESSVTGYKLRNYEYLHKLLEQYPAKTTEQVEHEQMLRMSSDEYLKSRPELQVKQAPAAIRNQWSKAYSTFLDQHPNIVFDDAAEDLLIEYVVQHKLPFAYNSFEAAFESLRGQFTIVEGVVSHGQISSRIDYPRKPNVPVPVEPRPVQIADSVTQKKFSPAQIRAMSSAEYQHELESNPHFATAVEEYFGG